jgi:prolyl oligopeptidase PreP (S9A serine peptidase family)
LEKLIVAQTIGSQFLGPWYDVFYWFFASALFFYWSVAVQNMPLAAQGKLPAFIKNKKITQLLGIFMALMGAYTAMTMDRNQLAVEPEHTWVVIDKNENGDMLFIDSKNRSKSGKMSTYWTKIEFKEPRAIGNFFNASVLIDRYIVSCKDKIISHQQSIDITDKGVRVPISLSQIDQQFVALPIDLKHPDVISFNYICTH